MPTTRGRDNKVLQSPYKGEIVRSLVAGVPMQEVARKYGLPYQSVYTFQKKYLSRILYERNLREDQGIEDALIESVSSLKKMLDSVQEWLTDPEDSSRINANPRAEELEVVYEAADEEGNVVRRKAILQELLDKAVGRENVLRVSYKGMDSRIVFIRAAESLGRLLSTLLKSREGADPKAGNITINFNSVQNAALQVAAIRQQMLDSAGTAANV